MPKASQLQAVKQKFLGRSGLIAFIVLMDMFVPLSIDLYLPALPGLNAYFGSSPSLTNMTLSAFFFFYAVGILLWGPVSDKYGRRPVILAGSLIYIISSVCCSLAPNIYVLIVARAVQGIGGGGIVAASFAIIKDCFAGKERETMLAITQAISGIAPMLAPVIGSWILKFTDWRGSFWLLAFIGAMNLLLTILYTETLKAEEKYQGNLVGAFGRLYAVGKNKSFLIPTIIFALSQLPFMGYLALSSYIYVDFFGLSEQAYSYFFAANSFIALFGPIIYVRFLLNFNKKALATICFALAAASGVLMVVLGTLSPFIFLVAVVFMSITGAIPRPYGINVIFDQQQGDTGTASSLFNTFFTLFGILGMTIASVPMGNFVLSLGALTTLASVLSIAAWHTFLKSDIPCAGIKE